MLRAFTSYNQNNWEQNLTAAEFACNNAINTSTNLTPFQINYGHHPTNPYSNLTHIPDKHPSVKDFLKKIQYTQNLAKDTLAIAKAHQEQNANRTRCDTSFQIGDSVLLSTKNLNLSSQTRKLSKKLQHRFIRPYKITQ